MTLSDSVSEGDQVQVTVQGGRAYAGRVVAVVNSPALVIETATHTVVVPRSLVQQLARRPS